ncbi:MAG: NAD(P)-dependent dehydrogenase (short-subunit alcohol dehydrogenase family) [Alphaproteobacteria bacterium]|jgi:NAD(P)-dependent dehydrogenase (short-subunit alcohol dehydrogenase family)
MAEINKLSGRVALVTGGGGAIGGASSRLLAAEGASVLVADTNIDAAEAVSAEIRKKGGTAAPFQVDVSDPEQGRAAVEAAVEAFGGLSILVNVAAAMTPDAPVDELPLEEWNRAFAVNLTGPFLMAKFAIPHMRSGGGGAIVNMASQLGTIGVPNRSAYCTTKAGLIHLTTILAAEVAKDNIRVNSISPGVIETPRTRRRFDTKEEFDAARGYLHMLGRVGQPEEVAKAVLFLASDDSSFTTATDLLVDGGYIYLKRNDQKSSD